MYGNNLQFLRERYDIMIYAIKDYITVFIEVMCCKIFFDIFCKSNKERSVRRKFIPVLLSVLIYAVACLFENLFIVKEIIIILITTVLMKIYNQVALKKSFMLSIVYQSVLLVADYLILIFDYNFLEETNHDSYLYQSMIVIMSKAMLFIIVMLLRNTFDKNGKAHFSDSQWIKFMFFPLFTICTIAALISNLSYIPMQEGGNLIWVISAGLVGMNIVVFYLLNDVALKDKKIHENALFETEAKNQLELYKTILRNSDQQRKLSHEYKNKIQCIQSLCELENYEELRKYLYEITGELMHDLDCIDTNHAIINAVINAKYQEAVDKNIIVVCKINDMSRVKMDSQDLVIIITNLLNNAIEACERCTEKKIIKLKLIHEKDKLIFAVKNTYNGTLLFEDGAIKTSKKSKYGLHGLGIQNVVKIIEKNNGYYVIKPTETEFLFSIIIPQ